MELLFFPQRRIFEGALSCWQRTPVRSMDAALALKNIQIFANSDLGGAELFRQISHQDAAVLIQNLDD